MPIPRELLGEGSYGCVFQPILPCHKKKKVYLIDKKRKVSKIFKEDNKDFQLETSIGKFLSMISNSSKYFIFPHESCYINASKIKKDPAVQQCFLSSNLKWIPHVILPFADYDFYGYLRYYKSKQSRFNYPAQEWILKMENLLLGIKELIRHQLVHQDIYMANVMYNQKEGVFKLIDFGLSHPFDLIFSWNNHRLTYIYHCYPPEYMFAYFLKNNQLKPSFEEVVSTWKNKYICADPSVGSSDCYHYYNDYIPDLEVNQQLKDVYHEYLQVGSNWLSHMTKSNVVQTLDLYALGMLCIDLHVHLDFSDLTPQQLSDYKNLVYSMMTPNYHKRPGFDSCYEYYLQLKHSIQKGSS